MKLKTINIYVVERGDIRPILLELMTDEGADWRCMWNNPSIATKIGCMGETLRR